jgi:hypothetical protein
MGGNLLHRGGMLDSELLLYVGQRGLANGRDT